MSSSIWKIRLGLIVALFAMFAAGTAQADDDGYYTGAAFLSGNEGFASGYAWGVVDGFLAFPGVETAENIAKIQKCLGDGNVTSGVFADAVRQTIKTTPALLPKSAWNAVLTTLYATCPVR